MTAEYRIHQAGTQFTVVDPWGERVNFYPTKEAAEQDIERCKKEDSMWETEKYLVDEAVKAHMQIHGVDRATSRYWIDSAIGGI
jgi:predicted nucleic acid-binding protein